MTWGDGFCNIKAVIRIKQTNLLVNVYLRWNVNTAILPVKRQVAVIKQRGAVES